MHLSLPSANAIVPNNNNNTNNNKHNMLIMLINMLIMLIIRVLSSPLYYMVVRDHRCSSDESVALEFCFTVNVVNHIAILFSNFCQWCTINTHFFCNFSSFGPYIDFA